jgi:hypothetical protein
VASLLRDHSAFMPSLARACLCHIARSNDIGIFFLSHCADASYYHSIASNDARQAYFYVVSQRANNKNKTFFIVLPASKQAMTTWYCEEQASARRIAMSKQF